jgi:hypothetical protein
VCRNLKWIMIFFNLCACLTHSFIANNPVAQKLQAD